MLEVDVSKRLGDVEIAAAFTSPAGVTALFGRSGAGKTSVVNMLAGLLRPDRGWIRLDGRVLFDADAGINLPPERRRLGYVFQDARLFPHLSVAGNLRYGMPRQRVGGHQRDGVDLDAVVEVLGLAPLLSRRPGTLSGGERQRVAIGRALLAAPELLLMDEPLASLDMPRRREILPFIEAMHDRFTVPVVYVTHNMGEIVRLADHLALISDGRIVAAGPVEEVSLRLDMAGVLGRDDAGAVVRARIVGHDEADQLSRLALDGAELWVPHLAGPVGAPLRLRIRARDVSLALQPPAQSSVLNVLPGTVAELGAMDGPQVDVLVDCGVRLWARITRRSLRELDLTPGRQVYALIKSVSVDRQSLGGRL